MPALIVAAVVASQLLARVPSTVMTLIEYSAPPGRLIVPVMGVRPDALHDGWGEPRSGHRKHEGIDIFAKRGTPVLAAAPGKIVRVGQNRLGGNVVVVAGAGAALYYYAHLDLFREGLEPGRAVVAGEVLGYVGTTGNAWNTPPHLHFGIYPVANFLRAIDPFPLLKTSGVAAAPAKRRA